MLSISACNIFKKFNKETQQTNVITDRGWKLVELDGKLVADKINGKEPFILLHAKDMHYSASGGCNGIGGTF